MNFKEKMKGFYEKQALRAKQNFIISDEQFQERIEICKTCEHFVDWSSQCKVCGCIMNLKARLAGRDCPEGKWLSTVDKSGMIEKP